MIRLLVGIIGLGALATAALAADPAEIGIGYLRRAGIKPALSLVEQPAQVIRGLEQPVGIWTCAGIAP